MVKENTTGLEKLFGSKTRTKLLELFFSDSAKSYYVREITRVIGEQINSVRRELLNLDSVGIIKSDTFDNKVYYSANMKHPYSKPLVDLFTVKVDNTKERDVHRASWDEYIRPVKSFVTALVVTNRMPGEDGVDFLVIGDDKTKKLTHWAELVEKKHGKPMNYTIMSDDEYSYRKSVKDRFLIDLMKMEITDIYDPEKIIDRR